MRYLKTIVLFLCLAHPSLAQTYTIKGTVKDTLNNVSLPLSSIVLINTKDSVIAAHTRTDSNGNFTLLADKPGKYNLRIAFPSFADYIEVINVNKSVTDLGVVAMVSKEHLLKEFVITKQISAIKIKGDTTEYVADSFKVKEGANVEALLKRLPGLQVDRNGQITAQGETVQKILVDGEEFFSDDPKVITKGLQANIVDKVQVYDKKSDQAEFTGVDDGQKTKTINLQLKENSKKGFFGKTDVGGGTDGYYQAEGMGNAFKGKRQVAVFGITSNTDKVGLGWQDNNKFGGSSEMIMDDDGNSFSIPGNNDDGFSNWEGRYSGEGFPKVWTGGAHFADKWNEDKNHFSANYRYALQQVEMTGNTTTQYALNGDTSNVSFMRKDQFSKAERHAADVLYELKIDSNNSIKITASGGNKHSSSLSHYNTITSLHTATADDTLYTNDRTLTSITDANFINSSLLFKKKFAKKGRTLSIDVKENYRESKSDGHLNSAIIPDTLGPVTTNIDEAKINNVTTAAFSGKATYTEPITKVLNMEVDYGAAINNTTSKNESLNKDASGEYTILDPTYSSDYKYNIFSNTGGLNFRWVYKKVNFAIGSGVSNTRYLQNDMLHGGATSTYNYTNLAPKASFKYKVSNQSSFNFNYYGNTQQPTITQIQPLTQNTDPTNITVGNPGLRQAFNHKLSVTGNDYKVLTHRWLYADIDFRFANDAISTAQTNKEGINKTQYINVNGNYGISMWAGGGYKLEKSGINVGVHLAPNMSHSINYINTQKNENDNNSYQVGINLSKYKEDKYDFSFNPGITYYDNKATISTYSTNYWQSNNEVSASIELPKKFTISTSVDFMFRQETKAFPTNNNVIKWNAVIGKEFFKDKLEITLSVFDILNQNIGYERTAQGSIITQNNFSTIRRYGMLNVIWNFKHQPGEAAKTEKDD